jgi:RNA polymerase sigma-70 factor (ECF subfamily)
MLKAWAARTSFRAGTSFRSWIYTILKNHFLSGKRRARFEGDWDELVASRMLAAPAVQEHGLHLSDVMRALENVGSVQREALMLTTVGEMSHIEAAAVMGVEVGTIKSRVFRARESLNRALSGDASATQVIYIGALPFGQRPSRQGGTTGA